MANADIVILQANARTAFHWTFTGSTGFFRQPRTYFPGNTVGLTRAEATLNLANPPTNNPWTEIVDYNAIAIPPPFPGSANGLGPGIGLPRGDDPPSTEI